MDEPVHAPESESGPGRRAGVIGLGLIGGSVAAGLSAQGWDVVGVELDPRRRSKAEALGIVTKTAETVEELAGFDLAVVATPVSTVAALARTALEAGVSVVTDVGSVKAAIVAAVDHPRFIGGHPMAGSEQEGLDGARADMFAQAVWVLTPGPHTDDTAYAEVRAMAASLGSDVVAIDAQHHDQLVAMVSHVPHLTAATLMGLADQRAIEHRVLLRLAAGGFRDMTRVASGHPGIWPDICAENRDAITAVLDELLDALGEVRAVVAAGDRSALLTRLEAARTARINLPADIPRDLALAELLVTVQDRPGELARITTLATEVDVNIYDLEIAHSTEGQRGVVIMVVPAARSERLVGALMAHGYRPSVRSLES